MSTESPAVQGGVNTIRTTLGIGGVVAFVVGILILVWPGHALAAVTWLIALYAVVAGIVYIGLGIFSKSFGGWSRVGHIVLGVLYIIAGVIMFSNLAASTALLALFFGVFVGIAWIIEGIVALSSLSRAQSKAWTVFFAIVSIVAGITLLFSPVAGTVFLWWLLGISLVVLGIVQVVRAFTFKVA
jgi:uncharacterized membrane protein HdeD (DUF308 family)